MGIEAPRGQVESFLASVGTWPPVSETLGTGLSQLPVILLRESDNSEPLSPRTRVGGECLEVNYCIGMKVCLV